MTEEDIYTETSDFDEFVELLGEEVQLRRAELKQVVFLIPRNMNKQEGLAVAEEALLAIIEEEILEEFYEWLEEGVPSEEEEDEHCAECARYQ